MDSIFNSTNVLANALTLQNQRAEVLANNLANSETPGFLARDFDFYATLQNAMGEGQTIDSLSDDDLQYRAAFQNSINGNTVDTNVEQAEFSKNAVAYTATLTFLQHHFGVLRTAIRGE